MMAARIQTAPRAARVTIAGRSWRLPAPVTDRVAWRARRPMLGPALAAASAALADAARLHRIAKRRDDRWHAQGDLLVRLQGEAAKLKRLARCRWLDAAVGIAEGMPDGAGALVRMVADDAEEWSPYAEEARYAVERTVVPRRPAMLAAARACRVRLVELAALLQAMHAADRRPLPRAARPPGGNTP